MVAAICFINNLEHSVSFYDVRPIMNNDSANSSDYQIVIVQIVMICHGKNGIKIPVLGCIYFIILLVSISQMTTVYFFIFLQKKIKRLLSLKKILDLHLKKSNLKLLKSNC